MPMATRAILRVAHAAGMAGVAPVIRVHVLVAAHVGDFIVLVRAGRFTRAFFWHQCYAIFSVNKVDSLEEIVE